jgi:hypothetical protein
MKQQIQFLTLILLLNACGLVAAQTTVPQSIQPPPGSLLKLQVQAIGEQIYLCTFSEGQFQWQLKAPEAALFDAENRQIGRHYAGPTWEYRDGSRITGKVLQKIDAPQQNAIPWLLVEILQHHGTGLFAGIRYINRIDTQGGLPPTKSCDANHIGSEKHTPYRAKYYFYTS